MKKRIISEAGKRRLMELAGLREAGKDYSYSIDTAYKDEINIPASQWKAVSSSGGLRGYKYAVDNGYTYIDYGQAHTVHKIKGKLSPEDITATYHSTAEPSKQGGKPNPLDKATIVDYDDSVDKKVGSWEKATSSKLKSNGISFVKYGYSKDGYTYMEPSDAVNSGEIYKMKGKLSLKDIISMWEIEATS